MLSLINELIISFVSSVEIEYLTIKIKKNSYFNEHIYRLHVE